MNAVRWLVLVLGLAAGSFAQVLPPSTPAPKVASVQLQVGDPAPALKVSRWVKGMPLSGLAKGQVYVVEFWATWCGPCRETIPHLTALAKARKGKAIFIGVDVWERGSDKAAVDKKVDAFVKEMGDQMDYLVCRDLDNHMATAWMEAAQQRGIPAAFLVDAQGRIAHVGHPGNQEFETALDQVIAGTWDLKAARANALKRQEEAKAAEAKEALLEAAWKDVGPGLEMALKAKDWPQVLKLAQAAETKEPGLKEYLRRPRFLALAATDPAKAQALVDEALAPPSAESYVEMAFLLSEQGLDRRWPAQALKLIDQAVALEPKWEARALAFRFPALLQVDRAKAKALYDAEYAKSGKYLQGLASLLVDTEDLDKAWLQSAVGVLEKACEGEQPSPFMRASLAQGYFKLGQAKQAAQTMERLLEDSRKHQMPPELRKRWEQDLKRYRGEK